MVLERTHRDVERPRQVAVDVDALDFVVERIFAAGLLLNGRGDGPQLAQRVKAVTGELDEALRTIQRMAFRSRGRAEDLDQIVVKLAEVADYVSELAEARNDGAGMKLGEAARSLHHARLALSDARGSLSDSSVPGSGN